MNNKTDNIPALVRPISLPVSSTQNDEPESMNRIDPKEAELLVFEMAKSYKAFVEYCRKTYKMDSAEADSRVRDLLKPGGEEYERSLRYGPVREESWFQLEHLMENDPEAFKERWGHIKTSALNELEIGWRAAGAIDSEYRTNPWDRAQFIALRHSLMEQWKPINGIETALIDTMAQAQTLYMEWMKTLATYMKLDIEDGKTGYEEHGAWRPPRISNYQAVEQAAAMADRFNRLFLRTLRQLRDLRRYSAPVTIQSAGQVNIGSQQVNLHSDVAES